MWKVANSNNIFTMMMLNIKIIFAVSVLFGSYWYKDYLQKILNTYVSVHPEIHKELRVKVFSQDELLRYNGDESSTVYLAVLGKVFDVTKGSQHYAKGAPYNYFTGKDGSRALITGDFQDESPNKDHVLDLKCSDLFNLLTWLSTMSQKYLEIGVLDGRYYDNNGENTSYLKEFYLRIEECKKEKEDAHRKDLEYPPCNVAWSSEEGTKVWCTKTSGGISREWVGVPRQLYSPKEDKPTCVCINLKKNYPQGQFKVYTNCPEESTTCVID